MKMKSSSSFLGVIWRVWIFSLRLSNKKVSLSPFWSNDNSSLDEFTPDDGEGKGKERRNSLRSE